jgi:hypothetical protein
MTFHVAQNCPQNTRNGPEPGLVVGSVDIVDDLGRAKILLAELAAAGVELRIEGVGLAFDGPSGVVTDDLIGRMRADRESLLVLVADRDRGDVGHGDDPPESSLSSGRPKVVHLKREPFDVRIDRESKWGNPFVMGRDGDRAEVIRKYRAWVVEQADLMGALPALRGKVLGCWCAPAACHGDVLADLVEALDDAAEPVADPVTGPVVATSIICPWCRSDQLADHAEGLRCDRCERMAWIVIGASLVRVDVADDDVDWLGPDEIDACPRCRDLCDMMTAMGGWACSRCEPQRTKITAWWLGIRERILKRR